MATLIDLENAATALEAELQRVIEQARAACGSQGDTSGACAAAWDAVEEIQAAIAHRKVVQKSSLEIYCDANPDAAECRLYDL